MSNTNIISIQGHSGCNLEIIHDEKDVIIEKSTYDNEYVSRLMAQASKQKKIYSKNTTPDIIIPEVLYDKKIRDKYCFGMKFYQASDFIKILEFYELDIIKVYIDKLIKFIDSNIDKSTYKNISKNILYNKVQSVKENSSKNNIERFSEIIQNLEKDINDCNEYIQIPIGCCHGDLTFSNILIQDENLILIDFLDNFIETPLQDVVKLRQDTRHKWTLNLINRSIDNTRIYILFSYLDEYVVKHFERYDFYSYYNIFQKINLLRIVPYAKDPKIVDYIKKEIGDI